MKLREVVASHREDIALEGEVESTGGMWVRQVIGRAPVLLGKPDCTVGR
ncbi:hypothetical protein [Microvirga roseola]|nr:hypothetical protein [Microvirga roseola]